MKMLSSLLSPSYKNVSQRKILRDWKKVTDNLEIEINRLLRTNTFNKKNCWEEFMGEVKKNPEISEKKKKRFETNFREFRRSVANERSEIRPYVHNRSCFKSSLTRSPIISLLFPTSEYLSFKLSRRNIKSFKKWSKANNHFLHIFLFSSTFSISSILIFLFNPFLYYFCIRLSSWSSKSVGYEPIFTFRGDKYSSDWCVFRNSVSTLEFVCILSRIYYLKILLASSNAKTLFSTNYIFSYKFFFS